AAPLRHLLEQAQAASEGLAEALLLSGEDAVDLVAMLLELRIAGAHLPDPHVGEPRQVRRLEPDPAGLLDGAPDDPPHHVAAALVRRRDAVGGEEGHAAAVIREDAVRLRGLRRVAVRDAALTGDPAHD